MTRAVEGGAARLSPSPELRRASRRQALHGRSVPSGGHRAGRVAVLSILWAVCAAGQEAKKEVAVAREEFRIGGVVVDAMTGLPVPGAELTTAGDVGLGGGGGDGGGLVFFQGRT